MHIHVLIDLERRPSSGGHMKCWEQLAAAATNFPDRLDLTLHVQGRHHQILALSGNVRLVSHRPLLSTRHVRFLNGVADHTDLAPVHPGLFRALLTADLIHTTDTYFSYANTARWVSRLTGCPLVTSLHTDVPSYTRIYAEKILRRIAGNGWLANMLIERCKLPARWEAGMCRKFDNYIRQCQRVLLAEHDPSLQQISANQTYVPLRRGIDKQWFHPRHRDRARLAHEYGIPPGQTVLCFVGRVDSGKNVMTLVHAAQELLAEGYFVHTLIIGEGNKMSTIAELLPGRATLTGLVDRKTLAYLYASADLFVFPSRIEIAPNVVLEAKASGLPVLVSREGGSIHVRQSGYDGIVIDEPDPHHWALEIKDLLLTPERRCMIAEHARASIETAHPSWEQVLCEDLLPVWEQALESYRQSRRGHVRQSYSVTHPSSR